MKRSGGNHVPRNFDELIERRSPWLSGDGPQAGMVLSTRMRLARNLQSVPFTHRARDEQLQGVMMSVTAAAERAPGFAKGLLVRMNDIGALERQILVERHLVSHELGDGTRPRGLLAGRRRAPVAHDQRGGSPAAPGDDAGLPARGGVGGGGRGGRRARRSAGLRVLGRDRLPHLVPDQRRHGLRASVLVHLPALVLMDEIPKVLKGISQVGLNVRGLYGEHSEVMGNLFQISNQTTLGVSERDSIESLERVVRQILEHEERARSG
jgi:protein arginine kinase